MCDYSLHAVASRPATVGETLVTTTFPGTTTRGFASPSEPAVAVCLLPGTELAFEQKVQFYSRWVWKRTIDCRVGKFGTIGPEDPQRHHDAIEFPDGRSVLVTLLLPGQRVSVPAEPYNWLATPPPRLGRLIALDEVRTVCIGGNAVAGGSRVSCATKEAGCL
jgi:hypothetical protein